MRHATRFLTIALFLSSTIDGGGHAFAARSLALLDDEEAR